MVGEFERLTAGKVVAARTQVQLPHPTTRNRAHEPPSDTTEVGSGGFENDRAINALPLRPEVVPLLLAVFSAKETTDSLSYLAFVTQYLRDLLRQSIKHDAHIRRSA